MGMFLNPAHFLVNQIVAMGRNFAHLKLSRTNGWKKTAITDRNFKFTDICYLQTIVLKKQKNSIPTD